MTGTVHWVPGRRWLAVAAAVIAFGGAQAPRLNDVVARVDRYVAEYGSRLENVVVEETYQQEALGGDGLRLGRTLRSDYALTFVSGRQEWIGYRDTFEVDRQPVRDHDGRLTRLLERGAFAQAARIAEENARYNLASERFQRTINTPTLALELLQPRYRTRFSVRRIGAAVPGDRWTLEFRERSRPTIVRSPKGRNQVTRIELLVDPANGAVHRTTVSWDGIQGSIVVTYGRVDGMPVLVPLSMQERFAITAGDEVVSEATYTNYRTFQTRGRVVEP